MRTGNRCRIPAKDARLNLSPYHAAYMAKNDVLHNPLVRDNQMSISPSL